MEQTRQTVLEELRQTNNPATLTGAQFESMVFSHAENNALGTVFEGKLRHTLDREFPDIVDEEFYGIEVKATKKDDWTSIGNSVLESSRDVNTEKIYVFFGKLGGQPDIMWRDYESCLKGIAVTHYPRYQIDMELADGHSIFDKMGISYDEIKDSDNPVQPIRRYYKSLMREGEALWWMDDNTENTSVSAPIITNFSNLSSDEKDSLVTELYVRFPAVLSNGTKKYAEVAAFLVAEKSVVSSSLRDTFSAGGRVTLEFDGIEIDVPKIVPQLLSYANRIDSLLSSMSLELLSELWQHDTSGFLSAKDAWLSEVDENSAHMELPVKLSILFEARLSGELSLPQ